jgi:hypothetical protein
MCYVRNIVYKGNACVPYIPYVHYIQEGFLRSTVMYLKDLSPYLR